MKDSNKDFIAYWDLNEFKELLQKGKELGSKYFFLIRNVGVCFYVRDTDFKKTGVFNNYEKEFSIHAEGLNHDQLFKLDIDDQDREFERLRSESEKLYEGDLCEWFHLSDELLNQVNKKIKEGYQKIRMLVVKPLILDTSQFNEKEIDDLKEEKTIIHPRTIRNGGSCPASPFTADISLAYMKDSVLKNLEQEYGDKPLFINSDLANEIIKDQKKKDENEFIELLKKGEAEEDDENYELSIEYYSDAIKLFPRTDFGYFKRARVYRLTGQIEKAIEDYDISIKINPKNFKNYVNRGIAKSQKKDFDGALIDLEKGIELNSNDDIAHMHLSYIKQQLKDFDGAFESLHTAAGLGNEKAIELLENLNNPS